MIVQNEELRIRNPFINPLVTELIEDPERYHKMFSERILVGETLQLYQPTNIVLLGPQGSGKTMLLNLLRYQVISKWLSEDGALPNPLKRVEPFLGISINLVRANFHVFGRRAISKLRGGKKDEEIDAICAADYLTHYLFREFLKAIQFVLSQEGNRFRDWLQTGRNKLVDMGRALAAITGWYGYYSDCKTIEDLLIRSEERLTVWRKVLNANFDYVPDEIWKTKASMEENLHSMGNILRSIGPSQRPVSLFVTIDQYENLPELNAAHGTNLQRIVNSLIKARDPVVFYKIGARNYDWGQELRIWGSEARVEVQRDYSIVNLSNVLMRGEDSGGWVFPSFARDVAYKRIKEQGGFSDIKDDQIDLILGDWSPKHEANIYFDKDNDPRIDNLLTGLSPKIKKRINILCGANCSPLDLRLAGAWVLQRLHKGVSEADILEELNTLSWKRATSWRKERISIALLQIASCANQRKRYFGWETILYLSGSNITAFLMLCGEIWDIATKNGVNPLVHYPLNPIIQSSGVLAASKKWAERDRNEHIRGRKRYEVLSRLGPAIRDALISDWAISNPGYSGFSLQESELIDSENGESVAKFLESGVSWASLEERYNTSKIKGGSTRRKWYLYPLLSPHYGVPYIRVKEPLYVTVGKVYEWIFGTSRIKFVGPREKSRKREDKTPRQLKLTLGRKK